MANIKNKGGIFIGNSHAEGGIDILVPETLQQIEVEGNEPLIAKEALENNSITEYTGTNYQILNKINQSVGAKGLNKKATTVHAGDVVICKKTLNDKTIKTIKGTHKQIISAINQHAGCNIIEPGATLQQQNGEVMQFKGGGNISEKLLNFIQLETNNSNYDISAKSKNSSNKIIYSIISYLARSKRTSGSVKKSKGYKEKETEKLKKYITKNNLRYSEIDLKEYISEGAEQKVYLTEGKHVIKTNDAIFYSSWEEYFYSLLLHNHFFPDTCYTLLGFTTDDNENLYAVVKQPYIKDTEATDLEKVRVFLAQNGFKNTKNNDYYNPELGIILEDLHDENVLTKDGILYFIDTVFYIKPSEFKGGGIIPENNTLYQEWSNLVNMTKTELEEFRKTPEGKKAGLTKSKAKQLGISSGQESAEWVIKMKSTNVKNWTPTMWKWAKKQINFIKRMSGVKGSFYDKKGNKTEKHTSLLIWGHNPEKMKLKNGGTIIPSDVKELLTDLYKDHHQAWETMQKISKEVNQHNCQECAKKLIALFHTDLKHHFEEEEKEFFPYIKSQKNKLNSIIVDELITQHHWFLQKITEMEQQPTPAAIQEFCNKLIQHIKIEEYLMSKFMNDPFKNNNMKHNPDHQEVLFAYLNEQKVVALNITPTENSHEYLVELEKSATIDEVEQAINSIKKEDLSELAQGLVMDQPFTVLESKTDKTDPSTIFLVVKSNINEFEKGGEVNYDKEWQKVKDIENDAQMGISEKGNTFSRVDEISPKYLLIKDYLIEKLKEKGYTDAHFSKATTGTIYVYPLGIGNDNNTIRISDHLGRGGVFSTTYDIRTLEAAKEVIKDIPTFEEYSSKIKNESDIMNQRWQKTKDFENELTLKGLAYGELERTYLDLDKIKEKGYSNIRQIILNKTRDGETPYKYEYTYTNKGFNRKPSYEYLEWFRENGSYNTEFKNGGELKNPNTKMNSRWLTEQQNESLYQLEVEFEKELMKKRINPNSKEASDFWRQEGYMERKRTILGHEPDYYNNGSFAGKFDEFRVVYKENNNTEEQSETFGYWMDALESFNKHNEAQHFVKIEGWNNNQLVEVMKNGTKKFKNGGEVDEVETEKINFNPQTETQLKNSIIAIKKQYGENKKEISSGVYMIQNNFFNEVVSYNPTMLLPLLKIGKELLNKSDRFNFDKLISIDYQDANTERFFTNLTTPLWTLIPAELRKVTPVKTIQFKPMPNDENLAKLTDLFVGTDDIRTYMMGAYFDTEHRAIVATNAHIMLHINEKPQVLGDEICILGKNTKKFTELTDDEGKILQKTKDGCLVVAGKYPQWSRVIPRDFAHVVTIKTEELYKFCEIISNNNLTNRITRQIFLLTEELKLGVNVNFLANCLKAMLLLGYKEIDMAFQEGNNRAIMIVPKGNLRKISTASDDIETDFTLLMPIIIKEEGFIFTYDLEKKCIENQGLEKLGCVDLDDVTETKVETTLIKPGNFVVKKHTNNKFYLVKSVDADKLTLINTTSLKKITNANASDYEIVKKEAVEDIKYAYDFNKRKALNDELKQKHPIVLEWTEGADIENKPYQNIEELEKDLKSFGFTDRPTETYIKNKVWIKGYPHYINIDLAKNDHDFNPEEQRLIDWLKYYDSKFDFTPFSEEAKAIAEKNEQEITDAITTLQLFYDLASIKDKEAIMQEINQLQSKKVVVRSWDVEKKELGGYIKPNYPIKYMIENGVINKVEVITEYKENGIPKAFIKNVQNSAKRKLVNKTDLFDSGEEAKAFGEANGLGYFKEGGNIGNDYGILLKLKNQRLDKLEKYVIERDMVNAQYYIAKNWLNELTKKAYKDPKLYNLLLDYLKKGGTIKLRDEILEEYTDYNHRNLDHFNAFDLLDTVSIK